MAASAARILRAGLTHRILLLVYLMAVGATQLCGFVGAARPVRASVFLMAVQASLILLCSAGVGMRAEVGHRGAILATPDPAGVLAPRSMAGLALQLMHGGALICATSMRGEKNAEYGKLGILVVTFEAGIGALATMRGRLVIIIRQLIGDACSRQAQKQGCQEQALN